MWKIIESSQYSIYFTDSPTIEVYITDFITLWHAYFSPNEFLSVLKESNHLLTGNKDEVYITKGKEILTTPEQLKHLEITPEEEFISVFMIKSFGYPFKIKLKLQRSSKELFFHKVTKPLIETADDLKKSESELKDLLIKKDREIERYKRENVQVLQYLKTPAFDEERHKHHYKKYRDTFGIESIPVHLLNKVIDCPELPRKNGIKDEIICTSDIVVKDEVIKTEPISLAPEIKLEPESQNETITNSSEACIKEEIKPEVENIKPEPLNSIPITSPRKKRKKWNI